MPFDGARDALIFESIGDAKACVQLLRLAGRTVPDASFAPAGGLRRPA
jgi:hypothetical protein